jgi:hypothetical protein
MNFRQKAPEIHVCPGRQPRGKRASKSLPPTTSMQPIVIHTLCGRVQRSRYQNFVLALLESRACIGWQRYEPYRDLVAGMKAINREIYALAGHFDK